MSNIIFICSFVEILPHSNPKKASLSLNYLFDMETPQCDIFFDALFE